MGSLPPGTDLSKVPPLAVNPNGDPPNFTNGPSLEYAILGVGLSLMIISVFAVALRLFTNLKHTRKLALDDYLCVFGEIVGIGYWGIIYSLAREGASRHTWDVPVTIVTSSFIKRQFAQQIIAGPMMWATKAAIAALYVRVFGAKPWMRFTSYALVIFMFLFYMSNVGIAAFYCIPRRGAPWDATAFARCSSPVTSAIVIGTFGVVADIVLFILPFPIILKLQLSPRKRMGLCIVFLAGFLTVITSVASLAYRVTVYLGNDPVWNGITVTITTFAEVFGTVTISCVPALSSFWLNIFAKSSLYSSLRPGLFSRRSRSTTEPYQESEGQFSSTSKLGQGHNHIYNELDDASNRPGTGPTRIYSSAGESIPMKNVIIRSTDTSQAVKVV